MAVTVLPLPFCADFLATGDLPVFFTTQGSPVVSSGNGRNGTNSLRFTSSTGAMQSCQYGFTAMATISLNFAIKVSRIPTISPITIMQFRDTATLHMDLQLTLAGFLQATRNGTVLGTTSVALVVGVHEHVEMKVLINDSTGTVQIWRNGSALLGPSGLSSQDTRNGGNATCDNVRWGIVTSAIAEPSTVIDISDLHIANDHVGDKRVLYLTPNGAGNYTDFAFTGGASNYESVDDAAQDGDTSYVSSATVTDQDSYTLANLSAGPAIFAAAPVFCSKKTDAGTRSFKPLLRISSTDYLGTEVSPGTTYGYSIDPQLVSPATATAFTISEINAMELGEEITA